MTSPAEREEECVNNAAVALLDFAVRVAGGCDGGCVEVPSPRHGKSLQPVCGNICYGQPKVNTHRNCIAILRPASVIRSEVEGQARWPTRNRPSRERRHLDLLGQRELRSWDEACLCV